MFPDEIRKTASTAAANYLFQVRGEAQTRKISEERAVAFHHSISQLLFLSGLTQYDIQAQVAFLTTRVKSLDKDDWGNLKQVL